MKETLIILVPVIIALVGGGGWLANRANARSAERIAMTAPYEKLAERLARLEDSDAKKDEEIDELKEKHREMKLDRDNFAEALDEVKGLLRDFIGWFNQGATPPPPTIPPHLRDQIGDYEMARVTEISRTTTERIVYPEEQP